MNYFIDTEFIECPGSIDLISLGMVSENDRTLYFESKDYDESKASPWVVENVIQHLIHKQEGLLYPWGTERAHLTGYSLGLDEDLGYNRMRGYEHNPEIAQAVLEFVGDDPDPVFWGYYCDYNWVVFCWLFGTMNDLPKGWPMYCRDLQQECDSRPGFRKPPPPKDEHNALADARWNLRLWQWLQQDEK